MRELRSLVMLDQATSTNIVGVLIDVVALLFPLCMNFIAIKIRGILYSKINFEYCSLCDYG
jgi:hypothetical protein